MAFKMAEEMLLYEMLDESIEEKLPNEDEGDIHLIGTIIPFMMRDIIRTFVTTQRQK